MSSSGQLVSAAAITRAVNLLLPGLLNATVVARDPATQKIADADLPTRLTAPALAAAFGSIGLDTDGVFYLTPMAGVTGSPIQFDTDGVPFVGV